MVVEPAAPETRTIPTDPVEEEDKRDDPSTAESRTGSSSGTAADSDSAA